MMEFFCKKKLFRKDISTKIFDQVQNKPFKSQKILEIRKSQNLIPRKEIPL